MVVCFPRTAENQQVLGTIVIVAVFVGFTWEEEKLLDPAQKHL